MVKKYSLFIIFESAPFDLWMCQTFGPHWIFELVTVTTNSSQMKQGLLPVAILQYLL